MANRSVWILAVILSIGITRAADESALTKSQGDAILEELKQIRKLLENQAARGSAVNPTPTPVPVPQAVDLKVPDRYFLGQADAPVTIVEFTDYQCSFCRQFHLTAFRELQKKYIDTGKVRFVSRDLPLEMHKNAGQAAQAAFCAGDQDKSQYWRMRDMLINNANNLELDAVMNMAQSLYVDMGKFRSCLEAKKYDETVQKEVSEAARLNVTGTPSFVIGKTTSDGVAGTIVVGAQSFDVFEKIIKDSTGN